MARPSHFEYLLESRCGFEQRNLRSRPIDGVFLKGVTQMTANNEHRTMFEVYLKHYKLTLQVILPAKFPMFPPTARLISDRDSVLPNHPDVDQAQGFIERQFDDGWTPAITVRDMVVAVLKMVREAGARSWANAIVAPKDVRGYYKEAMNLLPWQYLLLAKSSPKFLNELRDNYRVRIRFFGGEKGAETGSNYLRIESDTLASIVKVKQRLISYLKVAEWDRLGKENDERSEAPNLAFAAPSSAATASATQPKENFSVNQANSQTSEFNFNQAASAANDTGCFVPASSGLTSAMYSCLENADEWSRMWTKPEEQPTPVVQSSIRVSNASNSLTTVGASTIPKSPQRNIENARVQTLSYLNSEAGPSNVRDGDFMVRVQPQGVSRKCDYWVMDLPVNIALQREERDNASTTTRSASPLFDEYCRATITKPSIAQPQPTHTWPVPTPPSTSPAMRSPVQQPANEFTTCSYCFTERIPAAFIEKHQATCWAAPRRFDVSDVNEEDQRSTWSDTPPAISDSLAVPNQNPGPPIEELVSSLAALKSFGNTMMDQMESRIESTCSQVENMMASLKDAVTDRLLPTVADLPGTSPNVDQLRAQLNDLEDRFKCSVCMNLDKDHVIQCGHMFCGECLKGVGTCPICRAVVKSAIRVYQA